MARSSTRASGAQPAPAAPSSASAPTVTSEHATSQSLRVWSIVGSSVTSSPLVPLGRRKSETPSAPAPGRVRAATTRASAVWASCTKSLVPESVYLPPFSTAVSVTPAGPSCALGSIQASATRLSPAAIFGSHSFFWASLPASRMASPPSSTVEKYGPGATARPISSMSTTRSTSPSPMPSYASG